MAEENSDQSRLQVWVAILIAVATVIGGLVAWRASVSEDAAGDADFAGLHASMNVNETRALNYVNAYENYGAFVSYWRNKELGNIIAEEEAGLPEEEAARLEEARANAMDLAQANQQLFSSKFLDRKGTYNLQRQMGEMWADASREKDLNPDPQFADADKFRSKTNNLLLALLVLTIAPVFFSLVESTENALQKLCVAAGTLFMVAGVVLAVLFELGVL
jgi:hypothetical protein